MTISETKFNGGSNEFDIAEDIMLNFELGRVKVIRPTSKSQRVYLPNAQLTPWIVGGVVYDIINVGSYSLFLFDWQGNYTGIEIAPNQRGGVSLGNTSEEQGDAWRCNCRDLLSGTTTTSTTSTTSTTTTPTTTSTTPITTTPSLTTRTLYTGTWGDPGNGNFLQSDEDPRVDPNYTNLPVFEGSPTPFGVLSPALRRRRLPAALSVSVVVTAINEGTDLEMTLASLSERLSRSDKIVVVDDGSVVSLETRVRACERDVPILFVRHDLRKGCAQSRDSGARAARADLYVFVDSHMIFPVGWREEIVSAHSLHPTAIICPISADIADDEPAPKYGGHWGTNADLFMGSEGIKAQWTPIDIAGRQTIRTPGMMGACYAVPHDVLRAIGGWSMGLRGWGFDEEFACVRAWMMGYEVRLLATTYAAHRYERDPEMKRSDAESEEEAGWVLCYARAYANFVLFGKPVWCGSEGEQYVAREIAQENGDRWLADRDFIVKRRKMNERQFWDLMNQIRIEARILPTEARYAVNQ